MSRILIIEDEEAIAELEKDYLELSGFEVIICNRGDLGLNMALKEDFDLIILDLMLPEIDGFEICRQVREAKNTPIIMVSAKKDDIDKIRGLGLGADDYMTKPFSPSELVARVKAHMDRYVRTIYNKTNEMDHLINELTFYSKIDTNRIPYTFSKLNVEDYFEDCSEEVGLELETRGIELVYANYVEKDVMVIADGEQIRRVIHNIISNAIKYMDKPKGIIQIRIKDVGDFIQIEIEDNGKGIGPKDLPYIFDRFYRTDVSRNSSKGGSGIGLSIVKKILEDHGGKVWATSRLGIGTIMYFVLRKYQEVPMK